MADTNTVHVGTIPAAPGGASNYDVRLVTVERDVAGMKGDIGEIKSTMAVGFKELGQAISDKGAPNWHVVGIVLATLVAILGWGWGLFGSFQGRNELAIAKLETQQSQFMKRDDIVAMNTAAKEIADLKAKIAGAETGRNTEDIKALQNVVVPLSTHQELWKNQTETNKTLLGMIDENRKAIAAIAPPQETLLRIDKRLDILDERSRK